MATKKPAPRKITARSVAKDVLKLLEVIRQKPVKCEVCALGSMMVAFAYRHNHTKASPDIYDREMATQNLGSIFSDNQLCLIESAFEMRVVNQNYGDDGNPIREAIHFGKRYRTNRGRLVAICNNIIQNGSFRPELADKKGKSKG